MSDPKPIVFTNAPSLALSHFATPSPSQPDFATADIFSTAIPVSFQEYSDREMPDTVFAVAWELAQKDANRELKLRKYEEDIQKMMYRAELPEFSAKLTQKGYGSDKKTVLPSSSNMQSKVPKPSFVVVDGGASKGAIVKRPSSANPSYSRSSDDRAAPVSTTRTVVASKASKENMSPESRDAQFLSKIAQSAVVPKPSERPSAVVNRPASAAVKKEPPLDVHPVRHSKYEPRNAGPKSLEGNGKVLRTHYDPFKQLRENQKSREFVVDSTPHKSFDDMAAENSRLQSNKSSLQQYLRKLAKQKSPRLPGAIVSTPSKTPTKRVSDADHHKDSLLSYRKSPQEEAAEKPDVSRVTFLLNSINKFLQKRQSAQRTVGVEKRSQDETFADMLGNSSSLAIQAPQTPPKDVSVFIVGNEAGVQASEVDEAPKESKKVTKVKRAMKKIPAPARDADADSLLRVLEAMEAEEEQIFKRVLGQYRPDTHHPRKKGDALEILFVDDTRQVAAQKLKDIVPKIDEQRVPGFGSASLRPGAPFPQTHSALETVSSSAAAKIDDVSSIPCSTAVFRQREAYWKNLRDTKELYNDGDLSTAANLDLIASKLSQEVTDECFKEAALILDAFVVNIFRAELKVHPDVVDLQPTQFDYADASVAGTSPTKPEDPRASLSSSSYAATEEVSEIADYSDDFESTNGSPS
eukprot:ANDGO_08556.mRNA.1 hypothetical protein